MNNSRTQEMMPKLINPSNYLIANLDVLGIQSKLQNENEQESKINLSLLHDFIKEAKEGTLATYKLVEQLDTICFSDNIVIALKRQESLNNANFIKNCHCLILYVLCLQSLALANGFLLRGSIKFGDLYIDKEINFICGTGLIETHIEESNVAIYPRVITTDKDLLNMIGDIKLPQGYVLKNIFIKDSDDIYYLDYLQMFDIGRDTEEILMKSKVDYEKNFARDKITDKKVKTKHQWHINYFNNFCDRVNLPKYKIEVINAEK
jgi:hypothetical protein